MRKTLAIALVALGLVGCHGRHGILGKPGLPHGAPPGLLKKAIYRCGVCQITRGIPGSCHGKVLILID